MKLIQLFLILLLIIFSENDDLYAQSDTTKKQEIAINNFIIKENLLKNAKIAVIACNELERPLENINGTFQFNINGFKQALKFNDGVAIAPQQIDKSTFVYLRHENESGTHGKLYYVIKKDDNLKMIKINWLLLVLIPLGIIILATMFRKFIIIAAILLITLFFFNSSNGLNLPTFFETVFDGIKSVF